ncbi:MAG TPA: DUF3883 domain-containing protein [Flavobacterium sp.]|nr:DUF3883 domain-containing protein [Flavobacterium sp.]
MLKELRSFDNLGTPEYFYQLFNHLIKVDSPPWSVSDVEKVFYNKIINGKSIFDGCLILANQISAISICENQIVTLNPSFQNLLFSEKQMCNKFVELLFMTLKEDEVFHLIFSSQNISYDIVYHSIQINNSAFTLKHANFKQLLIDFDVIQIHPTPELKKYIINSRYKKLFDKTILPEIKKRKIGIDEFKKSMEQQQIHGEEAEKFVLEFENVRLDYKSGIDWVAEYSMAEGYDVSSFESIESIINDRFIEVKSFDGNPCFFWSRNELDISRIKGESYYLYLIDRSKMKDFGYEPLIIRNPFKNLLHNSSWNQRIEKYRFELIT